MRYPKITVGELKAALAAFPESWQLTFDGLTYHRVKKRGARSVNIEFVEMIDPLFLHIARDSTVPPAQSPDATAIGADGQHASREGIKIQEGRRQQARSKSTRR